MPFFSSSQFDQAVSKATSEMNTSEDWETIMDICDQIQVAPNGPRDCLRSILKRLNSNVPHHAIHALTLLDACIKNCGKKFHLQVCSHEFELEVRKVLNKGHPTVVEKLKMILQKCSEEFKSDPELSLIPSLYNSIKGGKGEVSEVQPNKTRPKDSVTSSNAQKEEEDLSKAIQLSLKQHASQTKTSSIYPTVSESIPAPRPEEKVRAMYDFEAAEENELSFKTGEMIFVVDRCDANWWKGRNHIGDEGLFPSSFVTTDLSAEPENIHTHEKRKSVQFNEQVKVQTLEEPEEKEVIIDEEKIDTMLMILNESDPSADRLDSEQLLALEENCLAMGPLIDKAIVEIDRRHASLTAVNNCLVESLHVYEMLMKERDCSRPYAPYPDVMQGYHSPQQHPQGFGVSTYLPTETYQPIPTSEHFQVPVAGALPTLQSRMMQSGQSHIPYGATNLNSCIPQGSVASTGGNFSASLPSREPSGMYYGDAANSMQHPTSISMQHQPML